MKYRLDISYDGTNYSGWQRQKNSLSVQQVVEEALATALRTPISIVGASRTDAGVHALNQVAHFCHTDALDLYVLLNSLNGILPADIRVHSLTQVDEKFHSRFDCISKTYIYFINRAKTQDPFNNRYRTHYPHPLDIDKMKKAAELFVGEHDFTSFANVRGGDGKINCTRTVDSIEITQEGDLLKIEFKASGFLYKMVRNIVGTLFDIGKNKLEIDAIPQIFAAKDRQSAPAAASPKGLFLIKIFY